MTFLLTPDIQVDKDLHESSHQLFSIEIFYRVEELIQGRGYQPFMTPSGLRRATFFAKPVL